MYKIASFPVYNLSAIIPVNHMGKVFDMLAGDYTAKPTCTAYSGTDNTGDAKDMFTDG